MIFALIACYFGGVAGCLIHFLEETDLPRLEAIGMSGLWPVWFGYALWRY
jgi:hypothetical protein